MKFRFLKIAVNGSIIPKPNVIISRIVKENDFYELLDKAGNSLDNQNTLKWHPE